MMWRCVHCESEWESEEDARDCCAEYTGCYQCEECCEIHWFSGDAEKCCDGEYKAGYQCDRCREFYYDLDDVCNCSCNRPEENENRVCPVCGEPDPDNTCCPGKAPRYIPPARGQMPLFDL